MDADFTNLLVVVGKIVYRQTEQTDLQPFYRLFIVYFGTFLLSGIPETYRKNSGSYVTTFLFSVFQVNISCLDWHLSLIQPKKDF